MTFHPSRGGLHNTLKPPNSRSCLITSFDIIGYHKYLQCSCTSATSSNQQPLATHLVHNLREKSCSCFQRGWNTEMYRFCLDCSCQWHCGSQNWPASISYRATVIKFNEHTWICMVAVLCNTGKQESMHIATNLPSTSCGGSGTWKQVLNREQVPG